MDNSSNNSDSPSSRFKVNSPKDPASGSIASPPPGSPPAQLEVNGGEKNNDLTNRDKQPAAPAEVLSPGSREGELSVPIIELPDGKNLRRIF